MTIEKRCRCGARAVEQPYDDAPDLCEDCGYLCAARSPEEAPHVCTCLSDEEIEATKR